MVTDPYAVVNARGRRIYLDPGDPRAEVLKARNGDLNPHSLRLWQDLLGSRRWDVVVDVGANYGEMLLGVDLPPHATVLAFEPNDRVADHLARSLSEAGLAVDLQRMAVSDTAGEKAFLQHDRWSGSSHLLSAGPIAGGRVTDLAAGPTTLVPTTTLDEAIGPLGARRACLKVDVEGAEDQVLAGGRHIFPRLQEVAIHIEILHRTPEQIAAWTDDWRVYLYDLRTHALIRVDGEVVERLAGLLEQPWIYRQDAVLRMEQPA